MIIISSSVKQQQLIMEFYKRLFSQSMKRDALHDICLMLLNTINNNTISSSYKSCAEMLKANDINPKDNAYTEAFTALKKLGIILKHNNRYLLNPAVEANYTSRRYELIIDYYNLLFKDTVFDLLTLDELKRLAVSSYTADIDHRNELIEENNYLYEKFGSPRFEYKEPIYIKSFDQLYELAFNTARPKLLSTYDKPIYKAINEAYRNVCTNQATQLFIQHIYILEEQGIVDVQWGGKGTKTNYTFHKFTLKAQKALISYDQTKYYLDKLPTPHEELAAQLFEDTQQQLQSQFEEEDASATLIPNPPQQQLEDDIVDDEFADEQLRIKDTVALIRKEGRFPTKDDDLPLDIHLQLCTEAHYKWAANSNLLPDKNELSRSIFSSISTR